MPYAWTVHPADPKRAEALARRVGVEPLIGQLLLNRGLRDPAEAGRFLAPSLSGLGDPLELPEMGEAVARIHRAIAAKEPILVFGDADVDGITASAIVYELLRARGAKVLTRLSNRLEDGYGLPAALIPRIVRLGIRLVILVDCGTNQRDEIRALARQGVDTVVLDHHVPSAQPARPRALVNPHCADASGRPQTASVGTPVAHPRRLASPNEAAGVPGLGRELCSAGLAFKLAQAMCGGDAPRLSSWLELAALGTLADCAPLLGDSRILVAEGTARILSTARPGLARVCESVRLSRPTPEQVLQRLVPRLNAPGRLGNPRPVLRLLLERNPRIVERLAAEAAEAHRQTKALSRRMIAEAHEQVNRIHFRDQWVVVVGRRGWHPGLVGPIAAQLADRYDRPAIAVALDARVGVGSGRAPSAFNLLEALRACEEILLRYGGHPQACGLTMHPQHLEQLRKQINRHAQASMPRERLNRTLRIDAEVRLDELTPPVVSRLEGFRPFGPGSPRPLMLLRDVGLETVSAAVRLTSGRTGIAVKGRRADVESGGRVDVVVSASYGDEVQVSICDVRAANAPRVAV
ncbi:MAG: DHH family phosphoesterase [Candidatus Omnitrophica bacterium]|nr:DHH family phosphoesterase [Candidatus Omnitrophota bacterium]